MELWADLPLAPPTAGWLLSLIALPYFPDTQEQAQKGRKCQEGPEAVSFADWISDTLCSRCFPATFLWRKQDTIAAVVVSFNYRVVLTLHS